MSSVHRSVALATARYDHGPQNFDEALKAFGFDDAGLRAWLVEAVDGLDGGAGWGGHQFWTPPAGGYIAVGEPRDEAATRWRVGVYLRRGSLQYPDGEEWVTVHYPRADSVVRPGR